MLSTYLKRIGLTTGPIKDGNTSYSGLEVIRKHLLCQRQFQGDESFLIMGSAVHEPFLQKKFGILKQLTPSQKVLATSMVSALQKHKVVQQLMAGAVCEEKKYALINGVKLSYILDIHQPKLRRGADIKTTSCTTYNDCAEKAVEYYSNQRLIYKKAENLKEFYFIFVSKKPPHNIFIIGDDVFKLTEKYQESELKFLCHFYNKYGKFLTDDEKEQFNMDL